MSQAVAKTLGLCHDIDIMRIGAFELREPLPQLRQPHFITSLRPWLDAGSIGTLALTRLEQHLGAEDLGGLVTPGTYFDFTRYRPMVFYIEDQRHTTIPNVNVRFARGTGSFDFVFVHLLEPHAHAEEYLDSIVALVQNLGGKRFCRIGGMYDAVPHTRPLPVMATLNGEQINGLPGAASTRRGRYQGPTSIMNLVGERLNAEDVENVTVMVRLPQYVQLEEDYTGAARVLDVLCHLYNFPRELSVSQRGQRQYERVSSEIERNAGVKALVERLEADYDARMESTSEEEPPTSSPLSPEVEKFLNELNEQLGDS